MTYDDMTVTGLIYITVRSRIGVLRTNYYYAYQHKAAGRKTMLDIQNSIIIIIIFLNLGRSSRCGQVGDKN